MKKRNKLLLVAFISIIVLISIAVYLYLSNPYVRCEAFIRKRLDPNFKLSYVNFSDRTKPFYLIPSYSYDHGIYISKRWLKGNEIHVGIDLIKDEKDELVGCGFTKLGTVNWLKPEKTCKVVYNQSVLMVSELSQEVENGKVVFTYTNKYPTSNRTFTHSYVIFDGNEDLMSKFTENLFNFYQARGGTVICD